MALLGFTGGELGDSSDIAILGSGITVTNTQAANSNGAYSIKWDGVSANAGVTFVTGLNKSEIWTTSYHRLSSLSNSASWYYLMRAMTAAFAGIGSAVLDFTSPTIKLSVVDATSSLVASSADLTGTLAVDTWYRCDCHIKIGAATGAIDATLYSLAGTQIATVSATSQNLGSTNIDNLFAIGFPVADRTAYVDDVAWDDAAFPGKISVVARQFVSTTPTYNAWTKSNASTIDTVWNDTPFSATTYASTLTASAAQTALISTFASTQTGHGSGTLGSYDTIKGVKTGIVAKTASTTSQPTVVDSQSNATNNGGDVTINFTALAGDLVCVFGGHPTRGGSSYGPSTSGYTQDTLDTATNTCGFGFWHKSMGTTPDTSVTCKGTGNTQDACAYVVYVVRGVNASTQIDATSVITNGSSTNPDSPSITTATNNALVISAAGSVVNDATITAPSGYSTVLSNNATDNNPYTAAAAYLTKATAGAENPASFTNWSTGAWKAITVALRPGTVANSSMSRRRRFGGADTDTTLTLTTSDAYYESAVFSATYTDLNACELGAVHGANTAVQTVEDAWVQVAYVPAVALNADVGTFTLTGKDATFPLGRSMAADLGTYTLTGQDAGLIRGVVLVADKGTYTLTGQDATFPRGIVIAADPGGYVLTGLDAALARGVLLTADTGTYTLTGQDAAFTKALLAAAEAGSFTFTGKDADFVRGIVLDAAPGNFLLTGHDATFPRGYIFDAATGAFTLTGKDASFAIGRTVLLVAETGSYTLTGKAATFSVGRYIDASQQVVQFRVPENPPPPNMLWENNRWGTTVAEVIRGAMVGKINATGLVTLRDGETTTTITDSRLGITSYVQFDPMTANAAGELVSGGMYVLGADRQNGQWIVTHSNDSTTDRTFKYLIIG